MFQIISSLMLVRRGGEGIPILNQFCWRLIFRNKPLKTAMAWTKSEGLNIAVTA